MASGWGQLADIATIAQLTSLDAVRLIGLIVKSANTARMHKKNCRQFAAHLKLIGNLLENLKISELKKYPETGEPLEQLEEALRRSYMLVHSCQDRSFLYLLAMGWNIVYQFKRAQSEIDRYLRLVPLITLVDNARIRERLDYIERDECEYTMDEDDIKVQDVIMKPEPSKNDTMMLKKTLSCSYPNVPFNEALQRENEKLKLELQISQAHLDVGQCQVIQHLIEVTEAASVNSLPEVSSPLKFSKDTTRQHSPAPPRSDSGAHGPSRSLSVVSSNRDLLHDKGPDVLDDWNFDLLGCCSEPLLCLTTSCFPCGTFAKIATVVNGRQMSSAEACNELMAYSLLFSCCCYTCCVRRKLRKALNIAGGCFDDFLSHLLCCCCALVQEWREVEARGISGGGDVKTKTSPPALQYMDS